MNEYSHVPARASIFPALVVDDCSEARKGDDPYARRLPRGEHGLVHAGGAYTLQLQSVRS